MNGTYTLWGARVARGGMLYEKEPVELTYDPETKQFWDKDGGLGVYTYGQEDNYGSIVFASRSHQQVAMWIAGALAAKSMMS
jgi:hypothetical protein